MGLNTEIVITGVGVVSPIGIGQSEMWESLVAGRSGVDTVDWLSGSEWPVRFGGELRGFEGKKYVQPRKSLKVMCREIQFGFSAASLAIENAGLDSNSVDSDRFGVVCGTEMFYGDPHDLIAALYHCRDDQGEYEYDKWGEHAMPHIYPLWMLMYLPNMVACHIAIAQDARGPNNSICLGEASSLLALLEAVDVIDRGHADVMVVGGAGSRLSITAMIYRGAENLSVNNDAPAQACRPFDAGRGGMVNGEGAGALVIETRAHAEARGAKPLARVVSGGRSFGSPESRGDGMRRAITAALEAGHCRPEELSHVNCEGVGTQVDDACEAAAIRDTLGDLPVLAMKSYFGNLGAGTGMVELAGSLSSLQHGLVPRTLNYETPDPKCPVNVTREPIASDARRALVTNQSSTGQAAAVVLERLD
ncbi:MAG: beta-ketoacyl-[acyl-carrier-protein] synthase family protein [Planctomycetales bacterium]|nr:beta-ketoacyl-[acyl-carrier-protein] synthase family protein [Planctomycetales bacterium]